MTAKELHKLSRQDLLQLLLAQSREVARQKETIEELKNLLTKERDLSTRLKEKLNEKDEGIARLKEKLNEKDEVFERLKEKLDDKDETIDRLKEKLDQKDAQLKEEQEQAENMRRSVESMQTQMGRSGAEPARREKTGETGESEPATDDWKNKLSGSGKSSNQGPKDVGEDRLRYLKDLLAKREAESKGQKDKS